MPLLSSFNPGKMHNFFFISQDATIVDNEVVKSIIHLLLEEEKSLLK
jgi:hypothetical protein